ncbi:hypothetical protein BDV95DRAFT_565194 [Massariosphaeria phaeospora]|uniref:Uncharacterized protein n=1 Tax=Massariosphaeria phaeospora TaxID=100035 RepID=A0A7C8ID06_9PLEO|nr:hypothetical protein BDV95DRAFT_565194 [Massariosphaeria phaeospora]
MSDKKPEEQSQEQSHIPDPSKDDDDSKKDEKKGSGGLLSFVGDPIGNVLQTGLRPLGAPLEKGVTGPLGSALGGTTRGALGPIAGEQHEKMEVLGGDNKDSYEATPEKIAGKEQTGGNPLGLDQTGRWGFEEEGEGKK